MKKKLKINLLKLLLKFDLLFVKNNTNFQKSIHSQKQLQTTSFDKKNYNILNPLEQIISIKQLIRLIQYLKEDTSVLTLSFETKYFSKVFSHLSLKCDLLLNSKLSLNFDETKFIKAKRRSILLFDIAKNKQQYELLFQQLYFLNVEIMTKLKNTDFGNYKWYNTLNNFKKIIFLILLIKKTH